METTISPVNPVKEMIYVDQDSIDQQTRAITDTLPFIQAVYEAYNTVPGVQPLDTENFRLIFYDYRTFIENCKVYWYNENFAASHKSIGITQAKGMRLVDDQVPDFCAVEAALNAYTALFPRSINPAYCSNLEAYAINNNQVIINPAYIDYLTENAKVYLESEIEFKVRDAVNSFTSSIKALTELIPYNMFSLEIIGGNYNKMMDFNKLHELFEVRFPRFEGDVITYHHNIKFYQRLKAYLSSTGQL